VGVGVGSVSSPGIKLQAMMDSIKVAMNKIIHRLLCFCFIVSAPFRNKSKWASFRGSTCIFVNQAAEG
jgi:hypothetical protein